MWPSRSPRWWPVKSPRPLFAVSAGSLRPGRRRWRCQQSLSPPTELLLKSARDRMDIISAYREAGSYRGAAAISGTTPKTVRRVIARHEAGGGAAARAPRERNYDVVTVLVAERVGKTAGRGVCGVGAELPPPGRGPEAGMAGKPSPWPPPGGVVAGRAPGDRLGQRGRPARVLRGAGLVPGPVRAVRS